MDMTKAVPTFVKGCGGVAGSFSPFIGGAVDGFTQYFTTDDGAYDSGFYIKDDIIVMQVSITFVHEFIVIHANVCSIRLNWSITTKNRKKSTYKWIWNICLVKLAMMLCNSP